jgi:hypothetical protein
MQAYIEHRLERVGWSGNPSFGDEAYDSLFVSTAGVPRRINTMVDRLLLYGALEELSEIDAAHVETVVDEVAEEIGYSRAPAIASETNVREGGAAGDLLTRVEILEAEVARWKEEGEKDRALLRKVRNLLFESGGDDE